MLSIPPTARVYAYVKPADMRKSFSGLVGIVEQELGQQVECGGLFLFFNRRHNSVKVLFFTGDADRQEPVRRQRAGLDRVVQV